jgi:LPXTG-motif cell wall-anchored protein
MIYVIIILVLLGIVIYLVKRKKKKPNYISTEDNKILLTEDNEPIE